MNIQDSGSKINFWANLLLVSGFLGLLIGSYFIYQRQNPSRLKFENYPVIQASMEQAEKSPIGIKIESAKISLPVIASEIKNNKWEATTEGVSYLKTSPIPGTQGNSILYGHNWASLLGNLKKVKPGDQIEISYSDQSSKKFLVEYLVEVKPEDTSILNNSSDSRITLYTCSGFLDSKRFVVVAKLLG